MTTQTAERPRLSRARVDDGIRLDTPTFDVMERLLDHAELHCRNAERTEAAGLALLAQYHRERAVELEAKAFALFDLAMGTG